MVGWFFVRLGEPLREIFLSGNGFTVLEPQDTIDVGTLLTGVPMRLGAGPGDLLPPVARPHQIAEGVRGGGGCGVGRCTGCPRPVIATLTSSRA